MDFGNQEARAIPGGVALQVTDATPQACWARVDPKNQTLTGDVRNPLDFPGGRAWDGRSYYAFMSTAVSPNGPTCQSTDRDSGWGHLTASSRHSGGSQLAIGDGRVTFVSTHIDAGDRQALSPDGTQPGEVASPYGLWGALGTRAGGEGIRVP